MSSDAGGLGASKAEAGFIYEGIRGLTERVRMHAYLHAYSGGRVLASCIALSRLVHDKRIETSVDLCSVRPLRYTTRCPLPPTSTVGMLQTVADPRCLESRQCSYM